MGATYAARVRSAADPSAPGAALALEARFGGLRRGGVFLGRSVHTPDWLYAVYRRFDALTTPVRDAVIVVELLVTIIAAWPGARRLSSRGHVGRSHCDHRTT